MVGTTDTKEINQVRGKVVIQHLPLIRSVAKQIHRHLPPGIDLEPLIHAGVVALLESLDRFNPRRGVRFEAYAGHRIRGEIVQCLRSLDWVNRSVRAWGRRIEAARTKLAGRLLRNPTAEEMAKELNISLERYFRYDQLLNEATLLSLEDISVPSEVDRKTHQQFTHNPFPDPLSLVERKETLNNLTMAVHKLPERERMVVTLYYYEELTLREIARILCLSEGRICQILAQAMHRLRFTFGVTVKSKDGSPRKCLAGVRQVQRSRNPVAV